ncbi:MAG: MogA/MoaB family molybdenum cofactor biosynthesis protein [Acidobacteriota bacterium]|jgi:molybdenum cofactor biosynthesis protein B|nr:MogA/MoaB family molybdenum cofactor biosynthesis protein [Acidobacteriota bacterium]NLT33501.1 MogA/MoaB family molybdenum cofactor biosynthesis protein [Acidobacteriota bacterium]
MTKPKLADSAADHKKHAHIRAGVAIVTLSSSRSLATDKSGDVIQELILSHGHEVAARQVLPDDRRRLRAAVRALVKNEKVRAIVTTGGTGLAPSDVTIESVRDLLDKELPGFNALFMSLSYPQVGSAAMLSRALAGTIEGKLLFCLPGSPRACRLAMESLILPELAHALSMLESR